MLAATTMVGLIPVAMAGGIVIGLTKEALAIPSGRKRKKGKRDYRSEADEYWAKTFGPPDK